MLTDVYQGAWDQLMKRPVPWLIFNAIFVFVGTIIPLLGGLALMPNLIRESAAAIEEDRDPDISKLFDTSSMAEDLGAMLLYAGAQFVGVLLCLVGWPIAWVLFWMTPEIRAGRMVSAMDAMKLSAAFVMANLGSVLGMILINGILLSLGSSLAGLGVFLVAPIITLSWTTWLIASREDLLAMADERGMRLLTDTRHSASL